MATINLPQSQWVRISGGSIEPALAIQFAKQGTLYLVQSATAPVTRTTIPTVSIGTAFKQFFNVILADTTNPLYGLSTDYGTLTIYTSTLTTFQATGILYYF